MPDHTLNDLWDKVEDLELKCVEMSTDMCWMKKILVALVLIGLAALGVQVPRFIP